ncbi:MAG: hypothetical protein PVH19_00040 [Planctomycetia bacterium]|jgi:hypothetical protein
MEALLLTSACLGVFSFLVWTARRIEAIIHRVRSPLKHAGFTVHEVPVSPAIWTHFCNLAAMRDTTAKRQLAEAIVYFLEGKVT